MTKDVLLVGFGAVGAIYSFILERGGLARVTAVARSNYDAAHIAHGIHVKSEKYGDAFGWKPDRLFNSISAAADRPYSYVVLTTKAIPEVTRTPRLLAPLLTAPYADLHPQPIYVMIQNGMHVEKDLYEAIKTLDKGEPKIVSTALYIATNLVKENIVEHGGFDRLHIGMYRHNDFTTTSNSPADTDILSDFSSMLTISGSTVAIHPEIQRIKFAKNLWNVAFGSFATLTGYTLPAIFRDPPPPGAAVTYTPYTSPATSEFIKTHTIPSLYATLRELITLARALGFPDDSSGLPSSIVDDLVASTVALHRVPESWHTPSMLLDVQKEQPIEVEVILGSVVRMAKEKGVDLPRIETLYALLLVVQNQILRKLELGRE